jgi:hypothetical protein
LHVTCCNAGDAGATGGAGDCWAIIGVSNDFNFSDGKAFRRSNSVCYTATRLT